jgi:hypothetical protein
LRGGDAALDDPSGYRRAGYPAERRRKVAGGVSDGLGDIAQADVMKIVLLDERVDAIGERRIGMVRGGVVSAGGGCKHDRVPPSSGVAL